MIRVSKDQKKLWFLPVEGTKECEKEFDLINAVTCPKCNNLIQALFITDTYIDPKPWEEIFTNQLDKDNKYKRLVPGKNHRYKSRYKVSIIGNGPLVSAEQIKLDLHFDPTYAKTDTVVCNFVATYSHVPEYRIQDVMLSLENKLNPQQYKFGDKDYATIKKEISNTFYGVEQYFFIPSVGDGPEVLIVERDAQQWVLNIALQKYYDNPIVQKFK